MEIAVHRRHSHKKEQTHAHGCQIAEAKHRAENEAF